MKKLLSTLLMVLVLALVACGGSDPTPVPAEELPAAPTMEAPTAEAPAEGSGSYLDSLDHVPDPNLVNKTWGWEARDPNGNSIPAINVPNPENYTLFFNEDGTFNAKMDCNNANGRYATTNVASPQPSIFMELGASQMAFCGESSLDQDMSAMFGPAQNYEILEDGNLLKFSWVAGGPVDYYRNATAVDLPEPEAGAAIGTVTAPDGVFLRTGPGTDYPYVGIATFGDSGEIIGVSEDGEWWLANAPNQPGGQVWVAAAYVDATNTENVPVVAAPPANLGLTGIPWEWVGTTSPAGLAPVGDPSRYNIIFNANGTANIKADCNSVHGSYTTNGSNISITTGASTMVACAPDSQDAQFLNQLTSAVIYFIDGGNLYLDLPADSGTMRFIPQGSPPPNPDAPAGEVDGNTFYLVSYGALSQPQAIIAGTQITADFANGAVTGSAGCNNYSGTLVSANDHFVVEGIVTTRKICAEPAGIMEQEQAYLAALGSVTGYQWQQGVVNDVTVVTNGQIFYNLPDGSAGVMNFVSTP